MFAYNHVINKKIASKTLFYKYSAPEYRIISENPQRILDRIMFYIRKKTFSDLLQQSRSREHVFTKKKNSPHNPTLLFLKHKIKK